MCQNNEGTVTMRTEGSVCTIRYKMNLFHAFPVETDPPFWPEPSAPFTNISQLHGSLGCMWSKPSPHLPNFLLWLTFLTVENAPVANLSPPLPPPPAAGMRAAPSAAASAMLLTTSARKSSMPAPRSTTSRPLPLPPGGTPPSW